MYVVVIMVMMMITGVSYLNLEVMQIWRLYLSLVFMHLLVHIRNSIATETITMEL